MSSSKRQNRSGLFVLIIVAGCLFPHDGHSQKRTDALEVLNSITKTPEFRPDVITLRFRFASTDNGLTKKEIKDQRIRSIKVCVDNKWGGPWNEKGCIRYSYDKSGNMTQSIAYDSTGKSDRILKYLHVIDNSQRPIKSTINAQNSLVYVVNCKYNEIGQILFRELAAIDPVQKNSEEQADLEQKPNAPDGNYTENYEYNAAHQLIKYEVKHGNILETSDYQYDSLSRLIAKKLRYEEKFYYKQRSEGGGTERWADSTSKQITEWEYNYNKGSNELIRSISRKNGIHSSYSYQYNEKGMYSEILQVFGNTMRTDSSRTYYKYDERGRVFKIEVRSMNNKLLESKDYTYTNKGSGGYEQKESISTNTGNTETIREYDAKDRLLLEQGTYKLRLAGGASERTTNSFSKKISYEFFR